MRSVARDEAGFRRYVQAVERFPVLDRDGELRLARRWQNKGDPEAARALVESNLRYVVRIAHKYRGYGLPLPDLVEEGNIGLLEAARRFDPKRKLRFMTYGTFWVRAYIRAYIVRQWSLVGVGSSSLHSKLFFRLRSERASVERSVGEGEVVTEELARRFGTTHERIEVMSDRLSGRDASLDAPTNGAGSFTLLEQLPDGLPNSEGLLGEGQKARQVRRVVEEAWGSLDSRERMILQERLMAVDEAPTLADLGRRLGLTRERVRQLEARVKSKLRQALEPVRAAG